jgi:hypothetical protein
MTAPISLVLFDMEGVLSHSDRAVRVDHLAALCQRPSEARLPDQPRHVAGIAPRIDHAQSRYHRSGGEREATSFAWVIVLSDSNFGHAALCGATSTSAKMGRTNVLQNRRWLEESHTDLLAPRTPNRRADMDIQRLNNNAMEGKINRLNIV